MKKMILAFLGVGLVLGGVSVAVFFCKNKIIEKKEFRLISEVDIPAYFPDDYMPKYLISNVGEKVFIFNTQAFSLGEINTAENKYIPISKSQKKEAVRKNYTDFIERTKNISRGMTELPTPIGAENMVIKDNKIYLFNDNIWLGKNDYSRIVQCFEGDKILWTWFYRIKDHSGYSENAPFILSETDQCVFVSEMSQFLRNDIFLDVMDKEKGIVEKFKINKERTADETEEIEKDKDEFSDVIHFPDEEEKNIPVKEVDWKTCEIEVIKKMEGNRLFLIGREATEKRRWSRAAILDWNGKMVKKYIGDPARGRWFLEKGTDFLVGYDDQFQSIVILDDDQNILAELHYPAEYGFVFESLKVFVLGENKIMIWDKNQEKLLVYELAPLGAK